MRDRPRPRSLTGLSRRIIACESCPRLLAHCRETALLRRRAYIDQEYWGRPVPGFGDPSARALIVGLAPAAHGANRTGRVFTGDSSGDWLYSVLHRSGFANRPDSTHASDGLRLQGAWITCAVRCAPPGNRPTRQELVRCLPWLEEEIRLLGQVKLVIALGRFAHEAWLSAAGWRDRMAAADRPRFAHGAQVRLPDGRVLLSSYHPSRQNTNTGRLTRAMWLAIFRRARALLEGREEEGPISRRSSGSPRPGGRSRRSR